MTRLFDWLMIFAVGVFIIFAVLLAYKGVKSMQSAENETTDVQDYSDDFASDEDASTYEDTDSDFIKDMGDNDMDKSTLDAIAEAAGEVKEDVVNTAGKVKEDVVEAAAVTKEKITETGTAVKDQLADASIKIKETVTFEEPGKADLDKDLAAVASEDFSEKGGNVTPEKNVPSSYENITRDIGYKYIVVAGTFSSANNADTERKRFEQKGYNGEVVRFDNSKYHTLSLGKFRNPSEAKALIKKLKAAGIDCYMHTKR